MFYRFDPKDLLEEITNQFVEEGHPLDEAEQMAKEGLRLGSFHSQTEEDGYQDMEAELEMEEVNAKLALHFASLSLQKKAKS